jgi:NAD(P)-dependent dehydrogenase (short-subunit alcohol dehydrogenase family)
VELDGIEGRVALVTGASRGIGRRIAETLRDLKADVAVADIAQTDVEGTLGLRVDVTDEASVEAAVRRVREELGIPQILVLNAGIFRVQPLEETTTASWHETLQVNLTGAFLCARTVLPLMREAGYGRVVSTGSSAGITGGSKNMAAYAASKAGLMALAKSIATEYAPHGITSNAVAPALIDTPMLAGIADLASRIPVGRVGQPEDVADIVAYLCSAHAGFITGAVFDVNGGFLIH